MVITYWAPREKTEVQTFLPKEAFRKDSKRPSNFMSLVRYGLPLYCPLRLKNQDPQHDSIDKIKVVFNDCLRLLTNKRREDCARIQDMLKELQWLSINQLCAETRLLEAWKSVRQEHYCLNDILQLKKIPETQAMTTRSTKKDLLVTGQKDKFSNSSFAHNTANIWNQAPNEVTQAPNLYQARKMIRKFVTTLPI